jgi:hypothetical protein
LLLLLLALALALSLALSLALPPPVLCRRGVWSQGCITVPKDPWKSRGVIIL